MMIETYSCPECKQMAMIPEMKDRPKHWCGSCDSHTPMEFLGYVKGYENEKDESQGD